MPDRNTSPLPAPDPARAVVVIPTFNERDNIPKIVRELFSLYPAIHVLVVDDHSPDGTAAVVRDLRTEWPNLQLLERMKDPGFAPSYRDGFRLMLAEPWCEAVITMDADFSHDPAEIRHMLEKLSTCDVVIGSRYAPGGNVENWTLWRRMLSRAANRYVHWVLGLSVRDATSGFVCMQRDALRKVSFAGSVSEGYAFLVELKYLLHRTGSVIREHPITFRERREGQSKMSAGKVREAVWMPWRVRRQAASISESCESARAPAGSR